MFGRKTRELLVEAGKELVVGSVDTLISVDGWEAGKDGRLLVAYVDKLVVDTISCVKGKKEKSIPIESLICVATLEDENSKLYIDTERLYPDNAGQIFVVSKAFTKLPAKQRLALLNLEFGKVSRRFLVDGHMYPGGVARTSLDTEIDARLYSIEQVGFKSYDKATKKANKVINKGAKKSGNLLYAEKVKSDKAANKASRKASKSTEASADDKESASHKVVDKPLTQNEAQIAESVIEEVVRNNQSNEEVVKPIITEVKEVVEKVEDRVPDKKSKEEVVKPIITEVKEVVEKVEDRVPDKKPKEEVVRSNQSNEEVVKPIITEVKEVVEKVEDRVPDKKPKDVDDNIVDELVQEIVDTETKNKNKNKSKNHQPVTV